MTAHITTNTEKTYPCIRCGSKQANIIREASSLSETKVKCSDTNCNFVYTAQDSKELEEKGQIPNGPPAIQESVQTKEERSADRIPRDSHTPAAEHISGGATGLPRSPAFIFISRDRTRSQLCTKRDLRKQTLAWEHEGVKYDVYELQPRKVSAKIDIQ